MSVLPAFGLNVAECRIHPFGSGLINHTWKIEQGDEAYILQSINQAVFKRPGDIAHNLQLLGSYLQQHHPGYRFIAPLATPQGDTLVYTAGSGYYRLFPFVSGSHSVDVVTTPGQAYEAARQFGGFTRRLSGFPVEQLHITIPSFHDLTLRYQQFLKAVENGDRERRLQSADLIRQATLHADIVTEFSKIRQHSGFRLRVTHHDTKISNVLFDSAGKGLCVIDLDTVMPGYFISDLGDMMRTYLSPVSEEEKDVEKIEVRASFYQAIVEGYLSEMRDELSEAERVHLFYAGKFLIYMQALRFLTDHLNKDVYYGASYPGHNFYRARNQFALLQRLVEKESGLVAIK
ncbi:MAG: aminoglycoside phosphotransferase family protein [Sphingobacteriales bacterium]|nr:aminoglycoside phosphotransferase family protein [Sphingobacteriales bacterium]OJW30787.1 MAG: aminoglycoside phosphotransferase [Sphingobacteriales bacterium 46-32]